MEFKFVKTFSKSADTLIFPIAEDLKLPEKLNKLDYEGIISKALKGFSSFKGKKGQIASFILGSKSLKRVVLLGLGDSKKIDKHCLRSCGGKLATALNSMEIKEASLVTSGSCGAKLKEEEFSANIAFGIAHKNYKFTKYFVDKKEDNKLSLKEIEIVSEKSESIKKHFKDLEILAKSINFARDLVSEPANELNPETYAEICKKLTKSGLKVTVLGIKEMKKLGMNALLGVGQGSVKESKMVILEWYGSSKGKKDSPVAFIGKGVTFDTGGISIKPSAGMADMKYDMAGSAAVVGVMKNLAERKAKVNAVGLIGLVENMPDGNAQRPSDVVKSMSGQTIEIDNTDAEGRLVLADVLWYAQQNFKPKFMINLATLTGAIVIALGEGYYAGLFSNYDKLSNQLLEAGEYSGDRLWRFPLNEFYDKQINSEIADVRNTGNGRGAGSITAAQFLQRFVNNYPWAHLDIAGMAWEKSGSDLNPKGATGYGVKLLDELVRKFYE